MNVRRLIALFGLASLGLVACGSQDDVATPAEIDAAGGAVPTNAAAAASSTTADVPAAAAATPRPTTTTTTTIPDVTVAPSTTTASLVEAEVGTREVDLVVDGVERFYRVHVPSTLPDAVPVPLVVDLHGFSASPGAQNELSGMSRKADSDGFVVAQPAGIGLVSSWSVTPGTRSTDDDIAFIEAVIADVASSAPIDRDRVYVTGFSNGGGMAYRLACDGTTPIAAIGTVAGAYLGECASGRVVPVIAFHGTDDFVVPYDGLFNVLPPVIDWAIDSASRNHCLGGPTAAEITEDVTVAEWTDCTADADVTLYTVRGGQHGWPGTSAVTALLSSTDTIDATDLMWQFFSAHPSGG